MTHPTYRTPQLTITTRFTSPADLLRSLSARGGTLVVEHLPRTLSTDAAGLCLISWHLDDGSCALLVYGRPTPIDAQATAVRPLTVSGVAAALFWRRLMQGVTESGEWDVPTERRPTSDLELAATEVRGA